MREMVKMVVVLVVLSSISGGLLGALKTTTEERIDNQVLKFVQGPAIEDILKDAGNDPVSDRFSLTVGDEEKNFFVGIYDGNPRAVAFETSAGGYGGDMGVMVAVDVETDEIMGISVTTHNETPGIGATIETNEDFKKEFSGKPIIGDHKVKDDGGEITAMSGATVTSRAACKAVTRAGDIYEQVKSQIRDQVKNFTG
ncbi:MAG: RnfABCDGE type electron transport complex subunit G [Desulfosalsimonas sp.]|uniref:RnfABCDGE type electron transport complex subunit G n=1 Tax=Desulfosalsimonas sp. TaxID=3073848 RepID=UPI00397060BE